MKLRTMTRLSGIAATVLAVAGGVIWVAMPVGAFEQERVVLDRAGDVHVDYDPIIGNNPLTNIDTSTAISKDTCSGTGCDFVPVTIKVPEGLGPDDEYFVQVFLEWDTQELENVPVFGTADSNDLDLFIQNDPIVEEAGPNEDGFTYYSAGTHMPEQVGMYQPTGDWTIFINNASGANTGYTLRFKVIVDDVPENIFESLPPAFSGGSAVPPPSAPPTTAFGVTPPPTVDIHPATPPAPDQSFDDVTAAPTLDDQLAAPTPLAKTERVSVARPKAPSSITLLLWMLALPLAILAGTGAMLLRRQRGLLAVWSSALAVRAE